MSAIKDKEMIDNIKNYSDEIVTIKDFVTAVRKMPGMYIGHIGTNGIVNMFREAFQNCVDELMKDTSPCDYIRVFYDERYKRFILEDNGRGIPFNDIIRICTSEHTGSNYNKKKGQYSSGLHGCGVKILNALSEVCIVKSYILGEGKEVTFKDGYPTTTEAKKIPNTNNKQGTIIEFIPSTLVMGECNLPVELILGLVENMVPLLKIGALVDFSAIRMNGEKIEKRIVNEDGILSYLIMKTTTPLIRPIMFSKDTGLMKAEIAFTYDIADLSSEYIVSFSNTCPTVDGKHIRGFSDGVCKFFKDYMNKIYLANNKKLTITDSDVKAGLVAAVSTFLLNPIFSGQAKEILSNEEAYGFVKYLTINYLDQWSKENPKDLTALSKRFKEIAEIRTKSDEGKVKLTNKYKASVLSGLPAKYAKPSGKEHLELIICEGDSAKGSAQNSRCMKRQGIFPIRGKIANSFTTTKSEFLGNPEVAGIITLVGGGYGKSFDLKKVPWESIILMADADKDGCHIDNLLLKLFLLYMRPIIEDGRLYRAVPPLYGAKKNGKYMYFTDKLDFIKYTQKAFLKNNIITYSTGKKLTELEVMGLFFKNVDYTYELERIANRYAINPALLELIVLNLNNKYMAKAIRKVYRFIDITRTNDTIVIKGLADNKFQTIFVNEQFLHDIKDIIEIINDNQFKYYCVNNQLISIYSLMKTFENNQPEVNRYKGLGEMNPIQLGDSTLHPDGDRTLIRYTIADAVKEIETIRYLESNRYELIKDAKATRSDILG